MDSTPSASSQWSDATVAQVVAAVMRNEHVLARGGRDDRYAVDGLIHAYRDLSGNPAARQRIGLAVAGYLRTGSTAERAIALSFYNACMDAFGGEALGELAAAGDDGFEVTTPVPIDGVTGQTMRQALFYAAFSWNGGAGVTDAMLAQAKEDALTGDGEVFLKDLARTDAEWFAQHETVLLSLYDKAAAAVWRARVEAGADPMEALDALKADIPAAGLVSLQMTIRFYRGVSADQKKALLAALDGLSTGRAPGDGNHVPRRRVTLQETTTDMLGDVRVGCGNIWERDFTDDSGNAVSRMSAKLAPAGSDSVLVYEGMSVEIGGILWRVDGFSPGADGRDRVVLSTAAS